MVTLTINIPDNQVLRVIRALCTFGGYQEQVEQDGKLVPNPQSRANFARGMITQFIKTAVTMTEGKAAQEAKGNELRAVQEAILADVEGLAITTE